MLVDRIRGNGRAKEREKRERELWKSNVLSSNKPRQPVTIWWFIDAVWRGRNYLDVSVNLSFRTDVYANFLS